MLAFLVVFTWALTFATWPVVRAVSGVGLLNWLLFSAIWGWGTARAAVLLLSRHGKELREEL